MPRFTLLLALVVSLSSCKAFRTGTVEGKLEATGGETWTLTKGECYSGQRENYFGVIGFGAKESGIAVKIAKDPIKGWAAIVNIPETCASQVESGGCKARVLTADGCDVLQAAVSRTNTTVNDIRVLEGSLQLDCKVDDVHLKGKLTFDNCH